MKNYIYIFASLLILASCATGSGGNQTLKNESESSVTTKIINSVTTQSEIKAMFGSPYETTYTDGGMEIWKYRLDDMRADAVNYVPIVNWFGSSFTGTRKELVILFNDDGTVKRNSMSESDVQNKSGMFNN
tara:strand:+ start:325 stop:717 length:393 start_codon:yes stop_codon:yes gene_type:complete